ncbi:transposase [Bacteroidia bacterium]|nr:transposase [Bacteroidia bacterium]
MTEKILTDKLHTTELGKERIKRNLCLDVEDVVAWCRQEVRNADENSMIRKGKNWYVYGDGYVLTVNVRSHTIITAHKSARTEKSALSAC